MAATVSRGEVGLDLPFHQRHCGSRHEKATGFRPRLVAAHGAAPDLAKHLAQSAIETQRRSAATLKAPGRLPTSEPRLAGFPHTDEYAREGCGQLGRREINHVEASSRCRIARTADTGESIEAC